MNLFGMLHCRNDEWDIGLTARVPLQWVDHLLVYAHCCTDRTLEILDQIRFEPANKGRVSIFVDPEPEWNEMYHRQYLLEWGREQGATHFAIIDSDELLTANLIPDIRKMVEQTPSHHVLALPGIQLWRGLTHQRIDQPFNTTFSLAFKDQPNYSYRPKPNGDQHHNGRQPMPLTEGYKPSVDGGIFHLQFVRWNTLRYKQLKYAMTETVKYGSDYGVERIRKRYSWWDFKPVTTTMTPVEWWSYEHIPPIENLFLSGPDDGSWYADEVRKMIKEHGRERFAGLNFYGLEDSWQVGRAD